MTQSLLKWLGYKGRKDADKQNDFKKFLDSLKLPYRELSATDPLAITYPRIRAERLELEASNNLEKKKWICLDVKQFKKVVMRLNTESADVVRDYYLNLEELMFEYAEYTKTYLVTQKEKEVGHMMQQLAIKERSEEELRREQEELQTQLAIKDDQLAIKDDQLAIKDDQLAIKDDQLAIKERSEDELRKELEDTKEYTLILQEMMIKDDPITRTQVIYIATTALYAKTNNFKVGGVDDTTKLRSRLGTYNTGRVREDTFYYSDVFTVSNYHIVEAQLKNLLGRFRNKKEKEMYRMHYTDIRYIVEYLCARDGEDVDDVNSRLASFIANLNPRVLRAIVPSPNTSYITAVTELKRDGTVAHTIVQSGSFEEAVEAYVLALSPEVKTISKRKVFDDLNVKKDRLVKYPIVKSIVYRLRPDLKLVMKC